jgi:hypothetical protein
MLEKFLSTKYYFIEILDLTNPAPGNPTPLFPYITPHQIPGLWLTMHYPIELY